MVAARRPFFPMLSQSHREAILEQGLREQEEMSLRLAGRLARAESKIEQALTAWWSATEPRDDGTVGYTEAIEDAMDLIWEALGTAPDSETSPASTNTSTGDPK